MALAWKVISLTLQRDWCVSSEGSSELHCRSRKWLPKVARQSAFTFRSDFSFMLEVKDRSKDGACEGRSTTKASLQGALLALTLPLKRKVLLYSSSNTKLSKCRQRKSQQVILHSESRWAKPAAPCDCLLALFPLWLYLDSTGAILLFIFPTEVWDLNPPPYFPWAQLKQGSIEWFFFS